MPIPSYTRPSRSYHVLEQTWSSPCLQQMTFYQKPVSLSIDCSIVPTCTAWGSAKWYCCQAWTVETVYIHDDVIKWNHFPRYWPFVWGIHRSPVNSPHKDQWREALMFSLICTRINSWVNNGEAGDLRRNPLWRHSNVSRVNTMPRDDHRKWDTVSSDAFYGILSFKMATEISRNLVALRELERCFPCIFQWVQQRPPMALYSTSKISHLTRWVWSRKHSYNRACHPSGNYWDYYPGVPSLSQVTAMYKEGNPRMAVKGHVPL